ncbi:hypothetical protein DY000_02046464 [Brassica cretica]|uniref:Uncharacterized protein n=1 Tax=Brassica cretica TaxID=69181 RepID=A0ABQ7F4B2_BRACR|nr:hypothetical protein DY000_02046464 [Brassica cretica]
MVELRCELRYMSESQSRPKKRHEPSEKTCKREESTGILKRKGDGGSYHRSRRSRSLVGEETSRGKVKRRRCDTIVVELARYSFQERRLRDGTTDDLP